ncbi:MAG TPA: NAD(P)/FAD-dependent oxidoreductase [Methanoregulaceae archaeon]|nr:NAD(P)/FAD-dependent oxidoreductase [Methanoregulaceae archaeon]
MTSHIEGAILQRDGKTYAISTQVPAGIISPDHLERIAKVSRKYKVQTMKITSGLRITLVGIKEEDLPAIFEDLGKDADKTSGPCLHYVQACLGTDSCKYGNQDSIGMAKSVENAFRETKYPQKLKIGVSGCPRCCAESHVRDIGIMGTKRGWTVIFGGNSGTRPRIGDVIAENLSKDKALDLVRRLLEYYQVYANPRERTARFMERIGIETLKSELLTLIPYIILEKAE